MKEVKSAVIVNCASQLHGPYHACSFGYCEGEAVFLMTVYGYTMDDPDHKRPYCASYCMKHILGAGREITRVVSGIKKRHIKQTQKGR